MKLGLTKKLQNWFKLNLNKIVQKYKSEEQKNALKIIKFLYESREAVSENKYKIIRGKRILSMLAMLKSQNIKP